MRHYQEWMINKGISYVSTPQIVHEFGCARSSVTDSIKKLKDMELIEVVQLSKHSSIANLWTSKTLITPKFPSTLIEEMKSTRTRKSSYKDSTLGEIYEFEDLLCKIYDRESEAEKSLIDNAARLRIIIRGYFINGTLSIAQFIDLYSDREIEDAGGGGNKKTKKENNGIDEIRRILNQSKHGNVDEDLYDSLAAQVAWYVYGQLHHLSDFVGKSVNARNEYAVLKEVRNQRWKPPKGYPADFTHRCFGTHQNKTRGDRTEGAVKKAQKSPSYEEI
jgi:hypothetical protein